MKYLGFILLALILAAPASAGPIGDTLTRDQLPPSRAQANNTGNSVTNPNTRNALAVAKAKGWRVQPTATGYIINGKLYPRDSGSPSTVNSPSRALPPGHGSGCRG